MSSKYPISRKFAPSWKHHMERYVFALGHCYRKKVMDAGSQMGFGSHMLSYVSNSVTLADISPKGISMSKYLHKFFCPTDFYVVDFEKDFPEGMWDTIVCFETIEHLENPKFFLENVAKHLNEGGQLVFSVPHMVANHDHKHLYDAEIIKNLIESIFTLDEFYIQYKSAISELPLYKGLVCYVGVATKK